MSKITETAAGTPDTSAMAAEAEHAARTMAPPAPDVTQNAGYTVRAVMPGGPAERGLLASWWVAAEDTERGAWVTWEAYAQDSPGHEGRLAYNAGHYFHGATAVNRREALADLAVRAGTMPGVAMKIADEMTRYEHRTTDGDRRAARRLRQWAGQA